MFDNLEFGLWHGLFAAAGLLAGVGLTWLATRIFSPTENSTPGRTGAGQERLKLALEAVQEGVWDWDIADNTLLYSTAWTDMLGLPATTKRHPPAHDRHPPQHDRAEGIRTGLVCSQPDCRHLSHK